MLQYFTPEGQRERRGGGRVGGAKGEGCVIQQLIFFVFVLAWSLLIVETFGCRLSRLLPTQEAVWPNLLFVVCE